MMTAMITEDNELFRFLYQHLVEAGSTGSYPQPLVNVVDQMLGLFMRFADQSFHVFPVEGTCFFCGHSHEPFIKRVLEEASSTDEKDICNRWLVALALELLDSPREGVPIEVINDLMIEIAGLDRRGLIKFCKESWKVLRLRTTKKGERVLGVKIRIAG